jgi:hypothetical protein
VHIYVLSHGEFCWIGLTDNLDNIDAEHKLPLPHKLEHEWYVPDLICKLMLKKLRLINYKQGADAIWQLITDIPIFAKQDYKLLLESKV